MGGLEGDGGSKAWKLGSPPGPQEEPGEPGRHLHVTEVPAVEGTGARAGGPPGGTLKGLPASDGA